MKQKDMSIITAFLFACLAACSKTGGPTDEMNETMENSTEISSYDPIHPPQAQQASATDKASPPSIPQSAAPMSWADATMQLPADQKSYLQNANSRFLGLLSYDTPEEHAKLTALGFPSPKLWGQYHRLGDMELKKQAESGDHFARLFYSDRLSGIVENAPGKFGDRNPNIERMSSDSFVHAASALRERKDAFSAYVYGYALSTQLGSREPMAAALMIGTDLGDQRASKVLHDFSRKYPDLRPDIIQLHYQGMKRIVQPRQR